MPRSAQSVAPLLLLAGLNAADEFDRIAFAALAPEIRDAFGLSDGQVLALNVIPGIMILAAAGPIGRLIDRHSRVMLSMVAALAWGLCSFLTGVVPTLLLLLVVRILGGVGRTANEIIHPSLLADKYEPLDHARVFLIHRLANPLAQVSGVVAGFIANAFGWRWSFVLLAIPTFAMALALARQQEPTRRAVIGVRREVPLREALRVLRGVPSLRRIWAIAFSLSIASFGMFVLASLHFEQIFGWGPRLRGFVQFVIGAGWTIGVIVGGRVAQRETDANRFDRLVLICAASFLLFTVGGLLVAVAPVAWLAIVATLILAIGNGVWQSPYFTAVAAIAPPGMSGQAYASSVVFYAFGGLASIGIGFVSDATSTRVGFALVALAGLAAALLARSASGIVRRDLHLSTRPERVVAEA